MLRIYVCIGLSALWTLSASAANISIGGQESTLSLEYHGDVVHRNGGLADSDTTDPESTTNIRLRELRLGLSGKFSDKLRYDVNYGLRDNTLYWGWIEWQPMSKVSVVVGYEFVNEGGWDNFNWLYNTIVLNPYTWNNTESRLPLGGTANLVELRYHLGSAGMLAAQFVDDVVAEDIGTDDPTQASLAQRRFSSRNDSPAWNLEYSGNFGFVEPLIQYGSYDNGHSNYVTAGFHFMHSNFNAFVDYTLDSKAYRAAYKGQTDSEKEKVYKHTAITADMSYEMKEMVPFLKLMSYDVVQPDTDVKGNALPTASSDAFDAFEDNAFLYMIGLRCNHEEFAPYLAVIGRSAKFLKAAGSTETETRSDMHISIGVTGKI